MTRTTTPPYEVSSESGRERMVRIPYARQTDATPTLHDPVQVTGLIAGRTLTGTSITINATRSVSILNIASGAAYFHNVRNVLTYAGGPAEATWGAINVGDPVYYDAEQDTLNGIKLSTSPLTSVGAANTLFGYVTMFQEEVAGDFPKGGVTASTQECAVTQTYAA